MQTEIKIENQKCHGCANTIKGALSKFDSVNAVNVDVEASVVTIDFEGTKEEISKFRTKLAKLGYPEQGANDAISVAKSYVSCAIGRLKK